MALLKREVKELTVTKAVDQKNSNSKIEQKDSSKWSRMMSMSSRTLSMAERINTINNSNSKVTLTNPYLSNTQINLIAK